MNINHTLMGGLSTLNYTGLQPSRPFVCQLFLSGRATSCKLQRSITVVVGSVYVQVQVALLARFARLMLNHPKERYRQRIALVTLH